MKVLHVIQTMAPRFGGPVVLLKALAEHQSQAGDEVTICTTNTDYPSGILPVPIRQPVVEDGFTVWYHPVQFTPLLFSLSFKTWIDQHIKDFDIVHIQSLYRFPVTYAAWAARKHGVPYVMTPQGSLDPFLYQQSSFSIVLKRLYERLFDFPNLNGASTINYTAVHELERTKFLNLKAPATIVPNGIDWHQYAELPLKGAFRNRIEIRRDAPLVLFLGRINFKKGLDLLIPAFSLVTRSSPDACLAIVGPDNEGLGNSVRQWCKEKNIANNVYVVDHLTPDEVCQAYVDADVFVLPSYTENFGMTVVEAMACQCPVVISDQVNIWPDVQKAKAGTVVTLSSQKIAEAILNILEDSEAATRMGHVGRRLARSYAYDRIVSQIKQMYLQAISK